LPDTLDLLAIAAHRDDAELTCGGTLAKVVRAGQRVRVVVGNIEDDYCSVARADGFDVQSIASAVAEADMVFMLIPDEVMPGVFRTQIAPHLQRGSLLAFASGFNVAFQRLICPPDVDVVLLAPRMIGAGVDVAAGCGAGCVVADGPRYLDIELGWI